MASPDPPEDLFLDTGILLNYIQQQWEGDKISPLFESPDSVLVISKTVEEEFEEVCNRRADIYPDMLAFLTEEAGEIAEFDPHEREAWLDSNDRGHIKDIQFTLAQLDDQREVLRRLRRYVRSLEARITQLRDDYIDEIVARNPKLMLQFAVADVVPNEDDVKVVCDAAYWAAENGGSGVLVTLDKDDLLDREADICATLVEEQSEAWEVAIVAP
jgi:hypothetical protein